MYQKPTLAPTRATRTAAPTVKATAAVTLAPTVKATAAPTLDATKVFF
jgi:hypothetical protein